LEKKVDLAELSAVTIKAMDKLAFRELAIHIAVSYIANTLSKCEFKTYENGDETRGMLYYMLNVNPNPNENSSQFINRFIEKYYYDGGSLIVEQNGNLYCADSFDVDDSNPLKGYTYSGVTLGQHQLRKKFKSSDVFHFKLDNNNVKTLIDLVASEYGQVMDLALQAFARTNGKKYKLLLDNYKAGDVQFNQLYEQSLKQQLKTFLESERGVYPQFKGIDLQEFGTSTPGKSDDIVAVRKEIFEVTAQAFKIPLSMMTGNITNMNEIVKVYLSICIDPLADMISEELTRKYYTYEEWKAGNYIRVDTSNIHHIDMLEAANDIDKLISSGVYCIDEVRARLGDAALNTDFSRSHFITKNYDLAVDVMNRQGGGENE
jgi:HK97 family phage portal protein